MTLRHFQIFQTVCRMGSITAAAGKLNMTQPAVSIAMKELESFYGVNLFERKHRRIYITDAGSLLLQYATTVNAQFEESMEALRKEKQSPQCRMGINISFAETRLSRLLRRLEASIPKIHLEVYIHNNTALEQKLRENEIDFAVVDMPAGSQEWKTIPLCGETMLVACQAGLGKKEMTVEELSKKPLLLREKGSGSRSCTDNVFSQHGCSPRPAAESASTLALLQMTEQGLGYTILPRECFDSGTMGHTLSLITISDAAFERRYYLIFHKNKYVTPIMQKAVSFFEKECQAPR